MTISYRMDLDGSSMTILGIDLGTTNTLAAFWDGQKTRLISKPDGAYLTPSVIGLDNNGDVLIGQNAKERLLTHPELTANEFKRKMGSNEKLLLGNLTFSPIELSSLVLQNIKTDAEQCLGSSIKEAVISVPAYFDESQRNATKIAAELAGLQVENLINEPTAAAVAYDIHNREEHCHFLVIDLGGGTFDVSIMELHDGVIEVHASTGDSFLGGEDFTTQLRNQFAASHNIKLEELPASDYSRLHQSIIQLKHSLATRHTSELLIELNGKKYQWGLSRASLNDYCTKLLNKIRSSIEQVMSDAHMTSNELSDIILVGGATRMPLIRGMISRMFRRLPSCTINPDEVVARGAAVKAAQSGKFWTFHKNETFENYCPNTYGVEIAINQKFNQYKSGFFLPILTKNSVLPISRVENISTVYDGQKELTLQVYQGDDKLTQNNKKMGEISIQVPPAKAGFESADIRFTCDKHGTLEVEATVLSTRKIQKKIFERTPGTFSDQQIARNFAELKEIKRHPRDIPANKYALTLAERNFERSYGEKRTYIAYLISQFEYILNEQDIDKAGKARAFLFRELKDMEETAQQPGSI